MIESIKRFKSVTRFKMQKKNIFNKEIIKRFKIFKNCEYLYTHRIIRKGCTCTLYSKVICLQMYSYSNLCLSKAYGSLCISGRISKKTSLVEKRNSVCGYIVYHTVKVFPKLLFLFVQ